jgi:hypothetical protein
MEPKMSLKTWTRTLVPTLLLLALPALSMAQISLNISVNVPPPELPVYEQPAIPEDGYIWTPGYWAWGDDIQDYYWVPGTWVAAPQPGYLWTPAYWGWQDGAYIFNAGYWGPHVGFYGGVNYGYGYGGNGFEGGYWQGGHLYYNRSVTNVGTVNITNVYNKTVINNVSETRVSFNGGTGGVRAEPTSEQLAAAHEPHLAPIAAQRQQVEAARGNPELRASNNHGKPTIAATARPGAFTGAGVVAAKVGGKVSPIRPASVTHAPNGAQPGKEAIKEPVKAGAAPGRELTPHPAVKETTPVPHEPVAPHTAMKPATPAPREVTPTTHAAPLEHAAPAEHSAPVVQHPAPVEHAVTPPPKAPTPKPEAKPAPRPAEHAPEKPEDREHH